MPAEDPHAPLKAYRAAVVGCTACLIRPQAREPVPAEVGFGDPNRSGPPPVLLVGRNPGANEDRVGRPFIGPAGKLLNLWLEQAGLHREFDCVTSNLVKCYTTGNAPPPLAARRTCSRFLEAELVLFQPKLVIGFGADVASYLSGGINRPDGRLVTGLTLNGRDLPPTYLTIHPSAALRSTSMRNRFMSDAEPVRRFVEETIRVDP